MTCAAGNVLHIIHSLSLGGASRALIAAAKYSSRLGNFRHCVVSLMVPDRRAVKLATEAGMTVIDATDRCKFWSEIEQADIVQLHFWNTPEFYELTIQSLPPMRLLIWCHVKVGVRLTSSLRK